MKISIQLVLLICFCLQLHAQTNNLTQKDTVVKYWEVVQVDSASKDELFHRARAWFNDAFKSSKDVLQIQDKETGELSGKGILKANAVFRYMGEHTSVVSYNFSMKILVKDGRYKYEATNFDGTLPDQGELGLMRSGETCPTKWPMISQKRMDDYYASAKEGLFKEVQDLLLSLKQAMSKPANDDF